MTIEIITSNHSKIAKLNSDNFVINEVQDALDLMANCSYQGATGVIVDEKHLAPEFFDLKTQLAGEILQKFSNYNFKLAIVGNFSKFTSKSLHDFIFESNKHKRINFVESESEAMAALA
ncbi:MAG TPA: DUF4180 domain-containing protein [Tenuifilaceae bacterium]|nr:DUF4180 domain-containing protein [Tenuifilaceae bacterium]